MATTDTSDTAETSGSNSAPGDGPSFLTLILGGFLAAAIGYVAAYYGEFSLFGTDDGAQDELVQVVASQDELTQVVASQEARLDQIESLLGAPDEMTARLEASDAGLSELQNNFGSLAGNIDSLNERIGGVEAGIASLAEADGTDDGAPAFDPAVIAELSQNTDSLQATFQARIDELSQRIDQMSSGEQVAALQQQLADLGARLDSQSDAIAQAQAAAEAETRRISAQAALSEIRAAIEAGEAYSDAVGAYTEASGQELPPALVEPAADGVATLVALQNDFPDAARAALDASLQVTAGGGALDRVGAFLKSQTGARALDEQEGTGPDAVLSRAEARLREGDLQAALSELDGLPQEGRDAMSGWISRAQARVDARAALADLATSTTSN